jgi:hypothetical protein
MYLPTYLFWKLSSKKGLVDSWRVIENLSDASMKEDIIDGEG